MILQIDNLDIFDNVYQINLSAIPNQNFTSTIANNSFYFNVITFNSGQTRITITLGDLVICNLANIKTGLNLNFCSKHNTGAFFFLQTRGSDDINFNYSNFGNELGLFYGTFK